MTRFSDVGLVLVISMTLLSCGQRGGSTVSEVPATDGASAFDSTVHSFEEGIQFVVIGDWGRNGEYGQRELGRQMGITAQEIDADFVISTGDHFYPNGVQSVDDYHWISSFESIYTANSLHVDWYGVLGNHDYRGNADAQIEYSAISRRWRMPSRYYSFERSIADSSAALFMFIDTNPFELPYYSNPTYQKSVAGQDTSAQKSWLQNQLFRNAKWKIVTGHHPLFSGGKRVNETGSMKSAFAKLFKDSEVDVYFCGHEHDLQIILPDTNSTLFVISGAGSEVRPTGMTTGSLFAQSFNGFMVCSINEDSLMIQAVDIRGKCHYRYQRQKKEQN
jgi:tartrate-resistant acid phosphatase type 5